LKKEAEKISETASRPIERFATRIEGHEPYVYEMKKTTKQGKCIFLKENICAIYPSRPLICRFYPFQLTTKNWKYRFICTKECPGMGKGKKLERTYFENLFRQAYDQLRAKTTEASANKQEVHNNRSD
jgi:Fe-S-cluster containining protein